MRLFHLNRFLFSVYGYEILNRFDNEELISKMVANERGLSPLRVFVVLFSIQIIFFLYHIALSNPGYVNPAAVLPWAVKVSGKLG